MSPEPTPAGAPATNDRLQARLQAAIATVTTSTHLDPKLRASLLHSLGELHALLGSVTANPTFGERLVTLAETIAHQGISPKPDRTLLERSMKALHTAAATLKEHEPGILATLNRLAMTLSEIGL